MPKPSGPRGRRALETGHRLRGPVAAATARCQNHLDPAVGALLKEGTDCGSLAQVAALHTTFDVVHFFYQTSESWGDDIDAISVRHIGHFPVGIEEET